MHNSIKSMNLYKIQQASLSSSDSRKSSELNISALNEKKTPAGRAFRGKAYRKLRGVKIQECPTTDIPKEKKKKPNKKRVKLNQPKNQTKKNNKMIEEA